MKSLVRGLGWLLLVAAAGAQSGCGDEEETTEWCDESCTIWLDCTGWSYDTCMQECTEAKDWTEDYLECLQAAECDALDSCG